MLSRQPPLRWRRGFSLYRRRYTTGADGEPMAYFDMEHPDFTAAEGSEQAVCWQSVNSWQQSRGHVTSGWSVRPQGELPAGVLEGRISYPLEAEPFDRLTLNGGLYEIRAVQCWPRYRKLMIQQIGKEAVT